MQVFFRKSLCKTWLMKATKNIFDNLVYQHKLYKIFHIPVTVIKY
jgi:hypothetical protein